MRLFSEDILTVGSVSFLGYPIPTSTDLIFFEESPDFCIANSKYGLPGTQGRECNASSISVDSKFGNLQFRQTDTKLDHYSTGCNLVCCDRGYTTEEVEVTERCNCTFRWCCEVSVVCWTVSSGFNLQVMFIFLLLCPDRSIAASAK